MASSAGYIFFEPRARPSSANWTNLPGATYTFYVSETTTLATIYSDAALSNPLPNPVEADSTGVFPVIYLDGSVNYRVLLKDENGDTLEDIDPGAAAGIVVLQQYPIPQTAAELAAGVTPVTLTYPPGNVLRYGTNDMPGTTDMSGPINNAIAQAGNGGSDVYFPQGQYLVQSTCTGPYSNLSIYIPAGVTISSGAAPISIFSFTNQTNIKIYGKGTLLNTGATLAVHLGGVLWTGCTYCYVYDLNFVGMQYCGVHGLGSSYCKVLNTHMSAFLGTALDAAGVSFLSTPTADCIGNEIAGNVFMNTGGHGVFIQDPYTIGHVPQENKIHHNYINGTTTYGIGVYIPSNQSTFVGSISGAALTVLSVTTGTVAIGQAVVDGLTGAFYGNILSGSGTSWILDTSTSASNASMFGSVPRNTNNEVSYNYITGVLGTGQATQPNPDSGAGIYVVGRGAGGTLLVGNQIDNCCIQTASASLAPAGIGCAGIGGNAVNPIAGPVLSANIITAMTQGGGITITGVVDAVLNGNQVMLPASNVGSGPGGGALLGHGLFVVNCIGLSSSGGHYASRGGGSGFFGFANGQAQADIVIVGGRYVSNGGPTFRVDQLGGFSNQNYIITGIRATNIGTTTTSYALQLASCTGLRLSTSSFLTSGTLAIVTSGTCTDSLLDTVTYGGGTGSVVSNSGTGMNIITIGSVAPSAGTWQAGDRVWLNTGSALAQLCTAGGSPGTWASKG